MSWLVCASQEVGPMSGPGNANVQSVDALHDVRLALVAFGERTGSAMGELRSKIDRTIAWLEQDRPLYWRDQERRAYDSVATTRIAYETCRLRTVGGRHSECIEEKIAHQRAKARLEYCKQKIEVVRRWNIEASRQVDEYRGRAAPLQRLVDEELPNMVAMLSRMIDALEAYAEIGPSPGDAAVSLNPTEFFSKTDDSADTKSTDNITSTAPELPPPTSA